MLQTLSNWLYKISYIFALVLLLSSTITGTAFSQNAVAPAGYQPCADSFPYTYPPAAPPTNIGSIIAQMHNGSAKLVSAHRGYWRDSPENSARAFWAAAQLNVPVIEIDVSLTSDNVPVLMHDSDITRTTNGTGTITSLSSTYFSGLYLRDRHGCVTSEGTSDLENMINTLLGTDQVYLKGTVPSGEVFVIDIKNRASLPAMYDTLLQAISTVDAVLQTDGATSLRSAFVYKVYLKAMPEGSTGPGTFQDELAAAEGKGSVILPNMIYVMYPDDPDHSGSPPADPTFMAYLGNSSTLHFETNEVYLNDPMTAYRQYLQTRGWAVAAYAPENFTVEGEPSKGICCHLQNLDYSSEPQGTCTGSGASECLDLRSRWDFLSATGVDVFTLERADDGKTLLANMPTN